jgi:hypothetical protein
LVTAGRDVAQGYDPWTGNVLWTHNFTEHPGCHDLDWTSDTTYLVKDSCATPAILEIFDVATGARLNLWRPPGASIGPANVANWFLEPTSCLLGRSGCKLFKAAPTGDVVSFADAASGLGTLTPAYWNVGLTGAVAPEPFADRDNVIVSGDYLLQQVVTDYVWATSRKTGQRQWISDAAGQLVAADGRFAYVINRDEQVVTLSLTTGTAVATTDMRVHVDDKWQFKQVYVHDGYMCVERLASGRETDTDERYYFSDTPVALVGVGS